MVVRRRRKGSTELDDVVEGIMVCIRRKGKVEKIPRPAPANEREWMNKTLQTQQQDKEKFFAIQAKERGEI